MLDELKIINENIIPYQIDITNKEEINLFSNYLQNENISVLVNCAGGGGGPYFKNILEEEPEYLENAFRINTSSTFNMIKKIAPKMIAAENPLVINITSIAGHNIFQSSSAYTIAKHSEAVLSKIIRRDLLGMGIKVTELIPSSVNSHNDQNQVNSLMPEDIAKTVKYICDLSPNININYISIGNIKELPFLS